MTPSSIATGLVPSALWRSAKRVPTTRGSVAYYHLVGTLRQALEEVELVPIPQAHRL